MGFGVALDASCFVIGLRAVGPVLSVLVYWCMVLSEEFLGLFDFWVVFEGLVFVVELLVLGWGTCAFAGLLVLLLIVGIYC